MSRDEPAPPALSASIVVYRPDMDVLRDTLCSLSLAAQHAWKASHLSRCDVRIICNDDSAGRVSALLETLGEPPPAIFSVSTAPGNIGFGAGHNLVIPDLPSRYHLILNPDVRISEDALSAGLCYMEANPGIKAVSPQAIDGAGKRQFLCKRYPTVLDLLLRGFMPARARQFFDERLAHYEMRDLSDQMPGEQVKIISGCFMLFRTETLQALAGFDSRYFLYFEDFDLSLRASRMGGLAYLPEMRIVHLGGNSARKGVRHILMFARSGVRFFNQWGWRWW